MFLPTCFFHEPVIHISSCCRLDRTSEFLVYGSGQQRRAVIEAVRLLENHKDTQINNAYRTRESLNPKTSPKCFKDKSRRWQKFVTQVIELSAILGSTIFMINFHFSLSLIS